MCLTLPLPPPLLFSSPRRWADRWKKDALRLLLFEAALGLREFGAAMQSLRPVTLRWTSAPLVWNAFGRRGHGMGRGPVRTCFAHPPACCSMPVQVSQRLPGMHGGAASGLLAGPLHAPLLPNPHPNLCRYLSETGAVRAAHKFLAPLRQRHPTCLPLMLMLGHCHLLSAQYPEALCEYFHAYRCALLLLERLHCLVSWLLASAWEPCASTSTPTGEKCRLLHLGMVAAGAMEPARTTAALALPPDTPSATPAALLCAQS